MNAPVMASSVAASDLSLGYRGKTVLSGISLSFRSDARAVGLAGPNGSGKTTFLKACLGLVAPLAGSLSLFGAAPGTRGFREGLRSVGWAPQHRGAGTLRLSVRELVSLGRCAQAGFFRPLDAQDRSAIDEAMETAGVSDLWDQPIQELSGGQWQRASIARALAGGPRLLLLDEPTTHLDKDGRRSVLSLLTALADQRRVTLVVVSHDEGVLALCDQFFAFSDGGARAADRQQLELG